MKKQEPAPPERVEISGDELHSILAATRLGPLSEDQYSKLEKTLKMFLWLMAAVETSRLRLAELKRLLFGKKTEKSKDVLGGDASKPGDDDKPSADDKDDSEKKKPRPRSHGRNPASSYTGATKHECRHETLTDGDVCPNCGKGKLYALAPAVVVVVTGQAPFAAERYLQERLRCNLCGDIFKAELPQEAKRPKYDETVASFIALLKYGLGFPFNRIAKLQASQGIPLPASTQWGIVLRAVVLVFNIIYTELIRQAAQCDVIYNDDTRVRILSHGSNGTNDDNPATESDSVPSDRKGTFTTGIVAEGPQGKI